MVRVTFTSPELADFGWNGPAAHIKLIFGQTGATRRAIAVRATRARRCVRTRPDVSIETRASWMWISSCTAKGRRRVGRAGCGRSHAHDRRAGAPLRCRSRCRVVLARGRRHRHPGDLHDSRSRCPPRARARVFIEVMDGDDEIKLPQHPHATVTWLHRGNDPHACGRPARSEPA